MYKEEDYLQLSGLQHFAFCRRQWALIHIENQWAENYRTVDGQLMHQNAHDSGFSQLRGDVLTIRAMKVFSAAMGVSGECDVVEFQRDPHGVSLQGRDGLWQPFPVEYKRGRPQENQSNALQLCCQAMCLEEMLCCPVPSGALYFGETRRRQTVAFTPALRKLVQDDLKEMHQYFERGYTPKVKPSKSCNACSLQELCMPKLMRTKPVTEYLRQSMEDVP
ncbi:MAG: CRISPR-associated protein Cas4 [Oscillospiraceae bacterium]|nr:CRISPR-associated protein Cas4 [Oscillospiraceae bacterium]